MRLKLFGYISPEEKKQWSKKFLKTSIKDEF